MDRSIFVKNGLDMDIEKGQHARSILFFSKQFNIILYSSNNIHSKSSCSVSLDAKHANDKAAKKANANRPRKSRPSDINRKPTNYPTFVKPPEYTISDN